MLARHNVVVYVFAFLKEEFGNSSALSLAGI